MEPVWSQTTLMESDTCVESFAGVCVVEISHGQCPSTRASLTEMHPSVVLISMNSRTGIPIRVQPLSSYLKV